MVGRRGPGSGLRQAETADEAAQWLCLFEALGSVPAAPLLPHLSLRSADAAALAGACSRAAASLRRILAETGEPLDAANGVLAAVYAELETREGARLARAVFALASDGFPRDADVRHMDRWEHALRRLLVDFGAAGLSASKRDVVVAMVAHHVAVVDSLRAVVQGHGGDTAHPRWLFELLRWRCFGSLSRALARVLSPAERERLAAFVRLDHSA